MYWTVHTCVAPASIVRADLDAGFPGYGPVIRYAETSAKSAAVNTYKYVYLQLEGFSDACFDIITGYIGHVIETIEMDIVATYH